MASSEIALVRELIELQAPSRALPVAERRRQYDRAEQAFGRGERRGEIVDANGCPAEWVLPQHDPSQPVVLYMHGGGYSLGSTHSHRHLSAAVGRAAGAAVLSIDYRRAPECPFPAAVDDGAAATRWLLDSTSAPVILAGDSAGGGLVLATLIALRDHDEPLPAAGVCLSPWLDLTCSADAFTRLAKRDPLLSRDGLKGMADAYLRDVDPREPLASPAFAELSDLPPLLIQVGSEEILIDDARRLAERGRARGVRILLEEWQDMIHVWQWYFPVLGEGREAIEAIASFIRRRAASYVSRPLRRTADPPPDDRERTAAASLIQEAHLLLVSATTGRGYLSWVYQLNGRLDVPALSQAIDEVVRRHEILRVRFERRDGRLHQVVVPYAPGTLELVDLAESTKQAGLTTAIDDVEKVYSSLSPLEDPRLRATLYTIDPKTAVFAMFVAEALVDSDSGSLVAAEIARAYARYTGCPVPTEAPTVSGASYLDYIAAHPPDRSLVARARGHWARQAQTASWVSGWPMTGREDASDSSTCAFALTPEEWAGLVSRARSLRTTPFVFALTCVQVALARVGEASRFLVHSIVCDRADSAIGMIGNFQSLVRIDTQLDLAAPFSGAVARTAEAVWEAVEHCIIPAPLAAPGELLTLPSGDSLPGIRFYMFASHQGPVFAGIRRRRFRLHGVTSAPLSVSCIYGPGGRQDFVFSSATAPQALLERLGMTVRAVLHAAVDDPDITVSGLDPAARVAI